MPATSDHATNRLVFLHGFTQTHHHWHDVALLIADRLVARPDLAFVDLPGHGLSADDRTAIDDSGPSLVAVGGAGTYVGYSMGGRFALAAVAAQLVEVERLVLIGATPGIDDDGERAERSRLDHERADDVERVGVDEFLGEWLAAPMFAGLPDDPDALEHRRLNTTAGLAHSLRACGTGNQRPLQALLPSIDVPVLVIAGGRDLKFASIGTALAAAVPQGEFVTIPDSGHAAHTERPEATADAIARWLDSA